MLATVDFHDNSRIPADEVRESKARSVLPTNLNPRAPGCGRGSRISVPHPSWLVASFVSVRFVAPLTPPSPRKRGEGALAALPREIFRRTCYTSQPFAREQNHRPHDRLQIAFPEAARRARLHQSDLGRRGARQARPRGTFHRLYRFRRDRAEPACRPYDGHHDAAPASAGGAQTGRADGRRHHESGRPVRQGRCAPVADRRDHCREYRLDQTRVRKFPDLRRRTDRRRDGQQRRMARRAEIHPVPARHRPSLFGQPHADFQLGQDAARA